MSRKSEYSLEEKIKACTEYLSGAKSATDIARKLDMGNCSPTMGTVHSVKGETHDVTLFLLRMKQKDIKKSAYFGS